MRKNKIISNLFFVYIFFAGISSSFLQANCQVCCDPRVSTILNVNRATDKRVRTIDSKVDVLDEKVDTIDSKIDAIGDYGSIDVAIVTIDSKIDVIDEKVDTIDSKLDGLPESISTIESIVDEIKVDTSLNVTIASKVDIVDQKTDTIDSKLDVANIELISIESKLDTWIGPIVDTMDSKLDTIDSKVDEIQIDVEPINSKLDALDDKIDTVDSKLDNLEAKVVTVESLVDQIDIATGFTETINSKVDVLDEKTDTIDSKLDVANIELVSIESKLDSWIGPLVETIDSKVDEVDSKIDNWIGPLTETIDSKIDQLSTGETVLESGETITSSGVYKLVDQINCPITVDADNVRIDLNGFDICGTCTAIIINSGKSNIVIKNGSLIGSSDCSLACSQDTLANAAGILVRAGVQLVTIQDMTIFGYDKGISFAGSSVSNIRSCELKNCVVECCNTGYELSYVIKTEFDSCRALDCYNFGYYQENSEYNIYRNSDAIKIENSDTTNRALGFASVDGLGNLYDNCLAEGVKTSTGQLGVGAVGFLLEGDETESKIINSIANSTSVEASAAIAYGIKLSGVLTSSSVTSYDHGANVNSVNWSHNVNYLALAGAAGTGGDEIRVLGFDGTSLSAVDTGTFGATVNSLSWRPGDRFLAAGGVTAGDGYDIRVFSFDGLLLDELEYARATHDGTVNSIDFSRNGEHLAVGGESGTGGYEVRVYTFDGVYLDEVVGTRYDHGATVNSVAWAPPLSNSGQTGDYLAIGGVAGTGGYQVRVLGFNYTSLYDIATAVYTHGATVNQVSWSPNYNYLAIVAEVGAGAELQILKFDSNTLTAVSGAVYTSAVAINSVDWSPNSEYIAVGTDSTTDELLIFSFNGYTLTQVSSYDHGADVYIVDWSQHGKDLAIGGADGTGNFDVRVLAGVMSYPTRNLIDGNKVCNTSAATGVQKAVGISGSSGTNAIVRNTAFDNDVNFSAEVTNLYDTTNDCCNDITENIPLPTKNQVEKQTCCAPELDVVLNLIDNVNDGVIGVESRLDNYVGPLGETIDSKVDILLLYKGTTAASCPWTIDSPGLYSLSSNKTCCVVINADHVTLDLNDFTLYCDSTDPVITVSSGHKNIKIQHGTIKGRADNTNDGILIDSNNNTVRLIDLGIYSCDHGIKFEGTASNNIKSCRVTDCAMQDCNKGVYGDYLIKTVFENCEAFNCIQAGFELQYSDFNVFDKCKALETQNDSADGDAIGFKSFFGRGNLFTECIAEGTTKATSNFCTEATGFLLTGTPTQMETETKIINCIANSSTILSGTGSVYGIHLEPHILSGSDLMELLDSEDHGSGSIIYSVNWSPDIRYLAVCGNSGTGGYEIRVYSFDDSSLTLLDSKSTGGTDQVFSVNWSSDGQYLAVGGDVDVSGNEVNVYSFDGSTLTLLDGKSYHASDTVESVDWSPDGNYLAVGGVRAVGGVGVKIYSFDGSSLTEIISENLASTAFSVNWSPDGRYLAVVTGGATIVYSFDGSSLTSLDTESFGNTAYSVNWSPGGNYLSVGGDTGGGGDPGIRVYRFDGSSLTQLGSGVAYSGEEVRSVNWSPDGKFLAVGGDESGVEIKIYSFDGGSLTLLRNTSHGNVIRSVNWTSDGKYLGAGGLQGTGNFEIRAYATMAGPVECLLKGNITANTHHHNSVFGYGIYGVSGNSFIANIGYANDINFNGAVTPVAIGITSDPNAMDNLSVS